MVKSDVTGTYIREQGKGEMMINKAYYVNIFHELQKDTATLLADIFSSFYGLISIETHDKTSTKPHKLYHY